LRVNDVLESNINGKYDIKITKSFPPTVSIVCKGNNILSVECGKDDARCTLFRSPACKQVDEEISNFTSNKNGIVDSNFEDVINAMADFLKLNIDNGNIERLKNIWEEKLEKCNNA